MSVPRTFPCPRCGEPSTWEGNEFHPFCSERCKMIDLGAWAESEYSIATSNDDLMSESSQKLD